MCQPLGNSDVTSPAADDFSLVIGGPLLRTLHRVGFIRRKDRSLPLRILFLLLLTWVPLFVLSLLQGMAAGTGRVRLPLLYDFGVYARFFVALPVMIIAEKWVDPCLKQMVRQFVTSGLVPKDQQPALDHVLDGVTHLRDCMLAHGMVLIASFLPLFKTFEVQARLMPGISTWELRVAGSEPHLTFAGWWFVLVASVVVRFILFRWLWRLFLWAVVLRRVSRLNLRLMPTHPDLAGGLGFLTRAQVQFGALSFASGAVLAGSIANAVIHLGASLKSFELQMIAYVVLAPLVMLAPLFVLAPSLLRVRRQGLVEYGALANRYTQAFDLKWVRNTATGGEPLLGTGDIQSLADLANGYNIIRQMRIVPISKPALLQSVAEAGAPFLPLFVFATPVERIVGALMKILM